MVDLKGQYQKIKPEVDASIQDVLNSTSFINGKPVSEFCDALAKYLSVKHVIPCANGTDALQVALMALDLNPGDEVITVPFTFIATAEVISLLQLKPIFVEVDQRTFNLDVIQLEKAITKKTKCIVPVHLYGQCCDMESILKIANKYNIPVVEDTAQAIGADYTFAEGVKKKAGTMGIIGCTSFFPSKNLGAYGDGGAIFTNDDSLADKMKIIVNHGSKVRYYHDVIGINSRLDTIQAAILKIKLRHLDEYAEARQKAAAYYDSAFKNNSQITTPFRSENSTHVFHQYTLQIENGRDELQKYLQTKGIPSMIYYPVPLHLQKAYSEYGYRIGDFPVSEKLMNKVISLPIHTELGDDELKFITDSVLEFAGKSIEVHS